MRLSPELDGTLQVAKERGYRLHPYHLTDGRFVVVAVRHYPEGVSDVLVCHANGDAWSYRAPTRDFDDVLEPWYILWCHQATASLALHYLLRLSPPDHPDAPRTLVRPPGALGIPPHTCTPVVTQASAPPVKPMRLPFTTRLRLGATTLLRRLTPRKEATHAVR